MDRDPANRVVDRLFAHPGLLDDAAPFFRHWTRVPGAGVLLALPAFVESGVFECARQTYGSLSPAFYGLQTTILALLLMALLRIKRPEGLKEHPPEDLGRILGLDRAPEVKTLRRKLSRLAASGRAVEFGRALARRRVAACGRAMGFLYADGHVRVYHGKRVLPKAHVERLASEALEEVRRSIVRELGGSPEAKQTKGTRFVLSKKPEDLSRSEKQKLSAVQETNQGLYRAYLLKQALGDALDYLQPARARSALADWLAWASRSRLKPFVRVARTIRKHFEGIIAYVKTRLTSGLVEGLNNKLRMIARRAFGFHGPGPLIAMLFLTCGGIQLDPPLP